MNLKPRVEILLALIPIQFQEEISFGIIAVRTKWNWLVKSIWVGPSLGISHSENLVRNSHNDAMRLKALETKAYGRSVKMQLLESFIPIQWIGSFHQMKISWMGWTDGNDKPFLCYAAINQSAN